jgi:hypothetical protein
MSVFQDLYDNRINFSVSGNHDTGFEVALGSELHGFSATDQVERWEDVEPWLLEKALEFYPDRMTTRAERDLSQRLAAAVAKL